MKGGWRCCGDTSIVEGTKRFYCVASGFWEDEGHDNRVLKQRRWGGGAPHTIRHRSGPRLVAGPGGCGDPGIISAVYLHLKSGCTDRRERNSREEM